MNGMDDKVRLPEAKHESQGLFFEWSFVQVTSDIRVYFLPYEPDEKGRHVCGFTFYVASLVATESPFTDWAPSCTFVQCLFQGVAYFDGLRHLYMGSEQTENYGYLYYANPHVLAMVFAVLAQLEKKYCSEPNEALKAVGV